MKSLLSAQEAAQELGVSLTTLKMAVHRCGIAVYRVGKRGDWVLTPQQVDQLKPEVRKV